MTENTAGTRRRDVLLTFGAVGAALASAPATKVAQAAAEKADEKVRPRYRETDHVRTFYSVNQYPGK
jgi:hypothetical protein